MFCTKCGSPMRQNAAFCTNCGTRAESDPVGTIQQFPGGVPEKLRRREEPAYAPPFAERRKGAARKKRHGWIVVTAVILIPVMLLGIVFGAGLLLMGQGLKRNASAPAAVEANLNASADVNVFGSTATYKIELTEDIINQILTEDLPLIQKGLGEQAEVKDIFYTSDNQRINIQLKKGILDIAYSCRPKIEYEDGSINLSLEDEKAGAIPLPETVRKALIGEGTGLSFFRIPLPEFLGSVGLNMDGDEAQLQFNVDFQEFLNEAKNYGWITNRDIISSYKKDGGFRGLLADTLESGGSLTGEKAGELLSEMRKDKEDRADFWSLIDRDALNSYLECYGKPVATLFAAAAYGDISPELAKRSDAVSGKLDPVKIVIFTQGDELKKQKLEKVIGAFVAKYPQVTVDLMVEDVSMYSQKLSLLFASGETPTVFTPDYEGKMDLARKNGLIQNMAPLVEKEIDLSKYRILDRFKDENGGYWFLPVNYDMDLLFYNKSMFDDLGLSYPGDDWTTAELMKAAQKLTASGRWGLSLSTPFAGYYPTINQFGGRLVDPLSKTAAVRADEKTNKAFNFIYEAMNTSNISSRESAYYPWDHFTKGEVAMCYSGLWFTNMLKSSGINYGIARIPKWEGSGEDYRVGILMNDRFCLSSDLTASKAGWTFIKFLLGEEAQKIYSEGVFNGIMINDAVADEVLESIGGREVKDTVRSCTPYLFADMYSSEAYFALSEMDGFFMGTRDYAEAINRLEAVLNEQLSQKR